MSVLFKWLLPLKCFPAYYVQKMSRCCCVCLPLHTESKKHTAEAEDRVDGFTQCTQKPNVATWVILGIWAVSCCATACSQSHVLGLSCRQYATGELTHAMLAFEFAGGWNDMAGSVAVTVLQFLLGGGGSFSAGGPGEHHAQPCANGLPR